MFINENYCWSQFLRCGSYDRKGSAEASSGVWSPQNLGAFIRTCQVSGVGAVPERTIAAGPHVRNVLVFVSFQPVI